MTDQVQSVILAVYSPILKRDVLIQKNNWEDHIIQEHEEMTHHLKGLISETLSADHPTVLAFRAADDPADVLFYRECPHFRPFHKFIKIAIRLTEKVAYVKSIYPVDEMRMKGVIPYGRD